MSFLFGKSKTISSTQTKLGAIRIQNSSQGVPIPIVFGQTRIAANSLWYGDFKSIAHTTSQSSGGKGGGGTTTENTSYTYTVGLVLGLFEGPSVTSSFIGKVWANKDLTTPVKLGLTEFQGTYSQAPWSYLTTAHPTQALGYRGIAYVATAAYDLGSSDSVPNLSWEVTGLLGTSDVNPADVLTQVLTSDKFGAGWPVAQLGDLTDFKAYCTAAGFICSPAYEAQQPALTIVEKLAKIGNAAPVWSAGTLTIKTYADKTVGSYVPDLTVRYNLGYDDFIARAGEAPVRLRRKRQADSFNQVQLEILDRSNNYNTHIAEAKDQGDIDLYGLRPMPPIQAHEICDANVGRSVAQTLLQRALYVRNEYEFTVGWRYARLEPMDIVTLTEPLLGLSLAAVRIKSIDENETGDLLMTAEDLTIGVSSPGTYSAQTSSGTTPNTAVDPGNANTPVIFQPPIALSGTPQVWIGASGGADWGGCQIYASIDGGTTYSFVGSITAPARYGALTANLPNVADPDATSTLAVNLTVSGGTLTSATTASADAFETLSYVGPSVGGEIVAYSTANLTSPFNYNLTTYLRRGQKGTVAAAHLTGADFMRLDAAVAHIDVSSALFGTTVYFKLLSFNRTGGGLQSLASVSPYTFAIASQVLTNGNGYAYIVDANSTANSPASGRIRWNTANQAAATSLYLSDTTADGANMATLLTTAGQDGTVDLRDVADTAKWATYRYTSGNAAIGYHNFGVTYQAGGVAFPNADTLVANFTPTLPTGVRSVGLALPASLFTVSGSPVTTTGNLTGALIAQNASTFFAGPTSGNAVAPAFRAFTLSDIPAGANGQVLSIVASNVAWANAGSGTGVGSVGLNMPAIFTVANSPLTANGTLGVTFANAVANTFLGGPSSGANAVPTMRALAGGDMPRLTVNTQTANYTLALSDANIAWIDVNSANAVFIMVPHSANVAFANGSSILLNRLGAGNLTISAQANVTVRNASSATARAQNSSLGLFMRTPNDWTLFGDTT